MDEHLRTLSPPIPSAVEPEADAVRAVLADLGDELCRPVVTLRDRFDRLLDGTDHPVSALQRAQIEAMVGVCDGLTELTRNYLDLAELSRGGALATTPGRFRLGDLVREVDGRFSPRASSRAIAWSCSLEGTDSTVSSDFEACLRIVDLVATNALDYSPEGGSVRVVVSPGDDQPGSYVISVVDDGPGIPAEERDRVFEPFYRLDREARSGTDANGLGLALSRALARGLGGDVVIDPTEIGTKVVIRLPDASASNS